MSWNQSTHSQDFFISLCFVCHYLQKIALHLSTVLTVGVVISVNPRAPPQHGTDLMKSAGTSSEREWPFPGLCSLETATPLSLSCQSNLGMGMEQNTQMCSLFLGRQPWILFPQSTPSVLMEGGAAIWWHHLGHLSRGEDSLLLTWSPHCSEEEGRRWAWEMAENWRPQRRLARHPSMRSRDWKLSCCNYRLWNRCGTH